MSANSNYQYVTIVTSGGTPIRVCNRDGSPYPTTGHGALVFNDGARLLHPTLIDVTYEGSQTIDGDFSITGSLTVDGNVAIDGNLSFTGSLDLGPLGEITVGAVNLRGSNSGVTKVVAAVNAAGTLTMPPVTDTVVAQNTVDVLTNKSMDGNDNTFTNLPGGEIVGVIPVASGGTGATNAAGASANLNTAFAVANIAALKALTVRPMWVVTEGYTNAGDGGGGPPWLWVAGSSATADDFMVVTPTSGEAGRYIRQLQAGANVSPKWAGCGLGLTDDSTQFSRVLNCTALTASYAVDASGGTYPIKGITVALSSNCVGLFSDGSGFLTPASASDANSIGITVSKSNFYIDNMSATGPISTDPSTAPAYNRFFYFAMAGSTQGVNWRVTNCRVTGCRHGVAIGGNCKNVYVCDNVVTGSWSEGIFCDAPDGCTINGNNMYDGGYAASVSGAIRIGASTQTNSAQKASICGNHIARYCVGTSQSAIDTFCGAGWEFDISNNVVDECGSGIEMKTIPTSSAAENIYQNITASNNTIFLRPAGGTAFSIFPASASVALAKAYNFHITGNHVSCRTRPATGAAVYGVTISGYMDVSVMDNFFLDVARGIQFDGNDVVGTTGYRLTISGNTIDAVDYAIIRGNNNFTQIYIHNNPMLKSQFNRALSFANGITTDLSVLGNYIWGVNTQGVELRDVRNAIFRDNTIVGGVNSMTSQTTPPSNILIDNNLLYVTYDALPAVSGSVGTPGVGLTDGLRTLTVTSGTGTVPTVFQCTVSGGVITSGVTIIQPGSYSVFPSSPTVTVDTGIVGGATFTLTAASPGNALVFNVGTGIDIRNNTVKVDVTARTVSGAGTYTTAPTNQRNTVSSTPAGTYAASVGDVFLNSAPGPGMSSRWICTTAGNVGAAVFSNDYLYLTGPAMYIQTFTSPPTVITVTIASPAVLSWASHGLAIGQAFQVTTSGSLPTGMSPSTTYFVISAGYGANSFQFSATRGGSAINTSGGQSGTHTATPFYVPHAGMISCQVETWGGGGGGGGAAVPVIANGVAGGAGGGAGGYSRKLCTAADIGSSKAVTIGTGGTGGTAGDNAGSNGTDTSLGSLCVGKGAQGGEGNSGAADASIGGAGGVAGTGDITGVGEFGEPSSTALTTNNYLRTGGGGSAVPVGAGARSRTTVSGTSAAGAAASGRASGGEGGYAANGSSAAAGGNGGNGYCVVTEWCNQ